MPLSGVRRSVHEAHHVKHWADGGETSLANGCLLCHRHHRAVHEGGVQVCLDVKRQVVFFTPRGKALLGAPPAGAKVEASLAGANAVRKWTQVWRARAWRWTWQPG
ncbi:MAG: HNH endonuclease signature motif containing protein [Gemmatimonadota bacterium]